jgi:SAM-dependent methyltransferase
MPDQLSAEVWRRLACPRCGGQLSRQDGGAHCAGCGEAFTRNGAGQLDLRLRGDKTCRLDVELRGSAAPPLAGGMSFERLPRRSDPEVDVTRVNGPCHLPQDLRGWLPRARGSGGPGGGRAMALDLGCGAPVHREVCELAGFEYVGLDYGAPEAMVLGDAQALPFAGDSFDLILSIAVLEHVPFPLLMMREAYRALAPGGTFLGTVAFLEPFHQDSYYHHTHLGLLNALQFAGFAVERIAPTGGWSGLEAQANMGLFPGSPRWLSKALVWPLLTLHQLWWRAGRLFDPAATDSRRMLKNSGALIFLARKPAS